jgi:hypothetical protein
MVVNNDNQEQKKIKKKFKSIPVVLTALIVVIVLAVGLFVYLAQSGYLYEKGYQAKIYDAFGICIVHHYQEATCAEPETCEICGITQGEALGHQWVEATCEQPKTCSVCLETVGSPLGHTVLMGKCGNCGEYQYELQDDFAVIFNYCQNGFQNCSTAVNIIDSANASTVRTAYSACTKASGYYSTAKDNFKKAYNACGDYKEFADLKVEIKKVIDVLPTTAPANSLSSCVSYFDKAIDALNKEQDLVDYSEKLVKEWYPNS